MRSPVWPIALLTACLGTMLTCVPAAANPVPDPANCTVLPPDTYAHPRILGLTTPTGFVLVVTVLDSGGTPMPDVYVQMVFGSACTELCVCPNAVLDGYTNASGVVVLVMALGGCCQDPAAATLHAMGIPIRVYDTVTGPDLSSSTGGGDCRVTLSDFSAFGPCMATGAGGCCDFTGDDATNLTDFVVFGMVWGDACR